MVCRNVSRCVTLSVSCLVMVRVTWRAVVQLPNSRKESKKSTRNVRAWVGLGCGVGLWGFIL